MDGTGELFGRFPLQTPPLYQPIPVRLPREGSYAALESSLQPMVPMVGPFAIVAESFSAPLGLRLAAQYNNQVCLLVLSNGFVRSPRSSLNGLLPWSILFRFSPPEWVIRKFLLGWSAEPEDIAAVRRVGLQISPAVMTQRVHAVLGLDDRPLLGSLRAPLLYLRGVQDNLVRERSVREIQRFYPRTIRCDFDAPHLLLQSMPRQAWARIEDALRDITSGR